MAALWKLPVVYVIENNRYGMGTSVSRASARTDLFHRGVAYGIPGEQVDGNDVLAVYDAARRAVERARGGGGPTLVESMTYRMKAHAEHDAQAYVPKADLEEWRAKDPIQRYARVLAETGIAQAADLEAIDSAVAEEVDREVDAAEKAPLPTPDAALRGVYANGGVEHAEPAIVRRNS